MKVFVEMPEDGLYYPAFAFFDTVTNTFDTWGGSQHWENLDELIDDMYNSIQGNPTSQFQAMDKRVFRYKSLLPARYGGDLP